MTPGPARDAAPIPLGPFDLLGTLGVGGMARVWRGVHRASGTQVAVKVLEGALAFDQVFQDAFAGEVRAVAALDHPAVVLVFDHGRIPAAVEEASRGALKTDAPYLVMEYAGGGTLLEHPPGRWAGLREMLSMTLDALAHAHARGVIHRDIKGGNVLRCSPTDLRPGWKLTDFGLALPIGGDDVEDVFGDTAVGTPPYMAPEQFTGEPRDFGPWTDLYGLGCLTWLLTTGAAPFGQGRPAELARRHAEWPVPAWEPVIPLPRELESWLRRMLQKDPWDRFQSAAEAARDLWAIDVQDLEQTVEEGRAALPSRPTDPMVTTLITDLPESSPITIAIPREQLRRLAPEERPPFPRSWRGPKSGRESLSLQGAGLGLLALRQSALVGREGQRDRLWVALERVYAGRGTEVTVLHGDPGQGKSALARWVCERALELGLAGVVRARWGGTPGPGQGLGAAIVRHFGLQGLELESARVRIAGRLLRLGGDVADVPVLLATAFGDGPVRTTPNQRYAAIARFLEAESHQRPVILWLDDVHAGPEVPALLDHLLTRGREAGQILVVATSWSDAFRDDRGLAELLEDPAVLGLPVGPLSVDEEMALLGSLISLEPGLAEVVRGRSEGNPLFAIQLVGDLAERGVLRTCPDGFALATGAEAALPADIHGLWQRRVERVIGPRGSEAVAAMEIGAALGDRVVRRELAAVALRCGMTLPRGFEGVLLDVGLGRAEDDGWSFSHGLLRESVRRKSIERGRWSRWNIAIADALSELPGERTGLRLERVGRHRFAAGQWDAAAEPLLAAVMDRVRGDDSPAGLRLLDLADEALELAGARANDRRRGRIVSARADAWMAIGDAAKAQAAANRVVKLARKHRWPDLEGRGLLILGQSHLREYRAADARLFLQPALARLEKTTDGEGTENAMRLLARALAHERKDARARAYAKRALASARQSGDHARIGLSLQVLAALARHDGDLDEAERVTRKAARHFERSGHQLLIADGYSTLAEARRELGDLKAARTWFEKAWRLWERIGNRHAAMGQLCVAGVDLESGDVETALPLIEDALSYVPKDSFFESIGWILKLQAVGVAERWDLLPGALNRLEVFAKRRMLSNPEYPGLIAEVRKKAKARGLRAEAARLLALEQMSGRLGKT